MTLGYDGLTQHGERTVKGRLRRAAKLAASRNGLPRAALDVARFSRGCAVSVWHGFGMAKQELIALRRWSWPT
jgi:hypothetical protein